MLLRSLSVPKSEFEAGTGWPEVPVIVGTWLFDKSPARAIHGMRIVKTQNSPIAGILVSLFQKYGVCFNESPLCGYSIRIA